MIEKPNYYSIIPADVRYNEELTPNAKLLYAEITSLSNKNGTCWASDNYFMKLYGVKKRSIQNWLKQLEDYKYIKREVTYKKGTKEIEKRYITLVNLNAQPYGINMRNPSADICVGNNTSINTTSNNNKDIVVQDEKDSIPYKQIIDYLNKVTNKNYRNVNGHHKHIKARWNEGFTLNDFFKVIDVKSNDWINDTKYNQYLRPSTLFGNKMDQYLNQKGVNNENNKGYESILEAKD